MAHRAVAATILAAVALATILAAGLLPRNAPPGTAPGPPVFEASPLVRYDANVTSFDGTRIVFTVWRPAASPAPLVLLAHGVTADRRQAQESGLADALVEAGFGVVALDLRGHGESGGLSRLSDPDHDVRDLAAVLDWCHDHLEWTIHEEGTGRPKDLLVGGWGFSLGGAMVHLSASLDGRLDAIVPQNTMNDYLTILAPNDAVKSVWAHLFIAASRTGTDVGPIGHWRADPVFEDYYVRAMADNRLPAEAKAFLARISPYAYLPSLRQPALYVQGFPDMAFPVNEALRSQATLSRPDREVELFTWRGGHHVEGLQPAEGASPCGDTVTHIVAWFNETLRNQPRPTRHRFSFAFDDGACVASEAAHEGWINQTLPPIALGPNAGSILVPVLTAADATRIVGAPILDASAAIAGVDDVFYASLVAVSGAQQRVLDSQVTPLRLGGPATGVPLRLEMNAIAAKLDPGDQLWLKLDRVNEWFFSNSGRTPGALALDGVVLSLPLIE